MDESNFFFDTNEICMVDFEDVGLLPQCFASFTMHCGSNPISTSSVHIGSSECHMTLKIELKGYGVTRTGYESSL